MLDYILMDADYHIHSTDTFYGIICAGLTHKTELSFSSSNSSFNECERKHNPVYHFVSNNLNRCRDEEFASDTPCQYFGQGLTYSSGIHLFKYVEFTSCSASIDHGGAIKCTGSTLEVLSSSFSSCTANGNNGGALYASSLSLFSVKNSVFDSCGGNYQVDSGGAIAFNAVTSPTIRESHFYKCKSNENSGAIDMRSSCNNQKELPLQSSCFIQCECFNGQWPSGGALEASGNECGYFSSVLFSYCKAIHGGALYLDPPFYTHSICFSFCTGNVANSNQVMDAYIRNNNNQINVFFHSFSTTSTNRVYDSVSGENNNWLLQKM